MEECMVSIVEGDGYVDDTTFTVSNQSKQHWCVEATELFINLMENYMDDLVCPGKRKHVFHNLHTDLASHGYLFTPEAVNNKWKSLMRVYKGNKDKFAKCGKPGNRFPFYAKMDQLWGCKSFVSNTPNVNSLEFEESQNYKEDQAQEEADSAFKRKRRNDQREAAKAQRHRDRMSLENAKLEVQQQMLALERDKINMIRKLFEQ